MIAAGGYQIQNFMLVVSVPISTSIRQHSLWAYLAKTYDLSLITFGSFVVDLKDVVRWLVAAELRKGLGGVELTPQSDMTIHVTFTHPDTEAECSKLPYIDPLADVRVRKRKFHKPPVTSATIVARGLAARGALEVPDGVPCPPAAPGACCSSWFELKRDPILLTGNYLKYQRGLSQSPWYIDGERRGATSVEEIICDVAVKPFKCTGYKFHTAGREDVDVRMLGAGRPFVIEMEDVRRPLVSSEELSVAQAAVNAQTDGLQITGLRIATKEFFETIKAGADTHRKTYACVCWTSKPVTKEALAKLDVVRDMEVLQRTPVRVLHRRSLATRRKVVHHMKSQWLNPRYFILHVTTSAGAYVKEFVHGDLGRTQPNVGEILGCDADILQLDVLDLLDPVEGDVTTNPAGQTFSGPNSADIGTDAKRARVSADGT